MMVLSTLKIRLRYVLCTTQIIMQVLNHNIITPVPQIIPLGPNWPCRTGRGLHT